MESLLPADIVGGIVKAPGLLVRPGCGQGIEHIRQSHQSGWQRNGPAADASGITAAIPFFVVKFGDDLCLLDEFKRIQLCIFTQAGIE